MHTKRSDDDADEDMPASDDDDDDAELSDDDEVDISDDDSDDGMGDISMEMNVEELMAQLENTKTDDLARRKEIRRRLEEIQELRSLDDTYSFDLYGED
jgi:hypothetical protein